MVKTLHGSEPDGLRAVPAGGSGVGMVRGSSGTDLTVVVIGLNAAATLEACLGSVHRAIGILGQAVRVIYVDGGSKDGSPALARAHGTEVIELCTDRPTAARGRNAGWRAAATPLVQFVDSDTVLEPDWLSRGVAAIQAGERIAALFGQLHEANPTGSLYNEVCGLDWYIPPGDWRMCGGNALFRLEALQAVDGSDEALVAGEEADLCWRLRRLGWRIVCVDGLMAHHDLGMTGFPAYWKRAERSGYAYAEIGLRFARTDDPMWRRELIRNLVVPPALLGLAALAFVLAGPAGLLALFALAALWLLRKVQTSRQRIPGLRLRVLYAVHLALVRLPLFVGAVRYLVSRRGAGRKGG